MNPCSAIQKSLYILERYLLPVSGTRVTTRFGFVCCRQYRSAPARSVPVDEPPKIPSLCKRSRAVAKLSASSISNASVTNDMSTISGMKSSPMPSTAQLPRLDVLVQNGAGWVGQDHFDSTTWLHAIEEAPKTGQCSARSNANDDGIDIVPHLFPNLRAGCALVCQRVRRITKLIHVKGAWNFFGEPRGHVLVIFRMATRHIGSRDAHFGSERFHMGNFFLRHLIRNHQQDAIAFGAGNERKTQA